VFFFVFFLFILQALAAETAQQNIRVNCLCPGVGKAEIVHIAGQIKQLMVLFFKVLSTCLPKIQKLARHP
jgi:NAD(P)-dependent dehydrogenase (short-subunit alcohol dehydrogenase family)